MQLYSLALRTVPRVLFAHTYETDRYCLHFNRAEDLLEITLIETGDVVVRSDGGGERVCRAPGIMAQFFDQAQTCMSEAPLHRHSTIGVAVSYDARPITAAQAIDEARAFRAAGHAAGDRAIIPDYLALDRCDTAAARLLRRAIHAATIRDDGSAAECTGVFFELLATLTRDCLRLSLREENRFLPQGSELYCRRAMSYVAAHIGEKITVGGVARFLGISEGYLSAVFKACTGRTLIGYVNGVKLERVRELIVGKGLSLREAGENVGFKDEHYLSRIFHKTLGTGARELKTQRMKNEDFRL